MKFVRRHFVIILFFFLFSFLVSMVVLKRYLLLKENRHEIIEEELVVTDEEKEVEEVPIQNFFVDVKGAVVHPGVYEIEENKKVIDVVNLAGGFSENADTSMINLARKVTNEMVVIIYTREEVEKAKEPNQIIKYVDKQCICPSIKNDACLNSDSNDKSNKEDHTSSDSINESNKINLNTATVEELQTLTGVGESKAKAIIAYREEKGGFKNVEEIKEVSGIGDALYEKIKDSITI